jgi:tRNA U34 2-thiouridine synthase MnmA/TrmU
MSVKNKTYSLFERDYPYEISIQNHKINTLKKVVLPYTETLSGHSIYNGSHIHSIDYNIILKIVRYLQLDEQFQFVSEVDIPMKYIPIVHDFGVLKNGMLCLDTPFFWNFSKIIPVEFNTKQPAFFHVYKNNTNTQSCLRTYSVYDPFFIFHYANIREENNRKIISKGKDESKDQSYVLWGVSQANLSRTMLPLGKFHKSEIKQMAIDMGQVALAAKSESYEICFVPDNDYRAFLNNKVPGLAQQVAGGNFVLQDGTVLGQHKGYPFYTVGQRKGLEIALGEPMFVLDIQPDKNEVVLGKIGELEKQEAIVRGFNLVKYENILTPIDSLTKIRYKDKGTLSSIVQESDYIKVDFYSPVSGLAPGQSAVFYEGNDLIGGGIISKK